MEIKRVLVTGANGYIGHHLIKELLNLGHKVYAVDLNFSNVDPRAKKIECSIFNQSQNIYNELEKPDICIHLAWKDGFLHNSHLHMEELSNHYTFINNMLLGGLPQIVVMGSMHEIGYWEGAINEDTPTNPMSLYGIAKNSLRQAVDILCKEYNAIYQWIRGYYIVGDDLNNHSIFAKILNMELEGKSHFPFNSGKNKYDFISIEELTQQIAITVSQTEITGIINCCSGIPVSLSDKVEEFIKEHKMKIRLDYGQYPDRPYDSPAIWGDNSKIKRIIELMKNKENF